MKIYRTKSDFSNFHRYSIKSWKLTNSFIRFCSSLQFSFNSNVFFKVIINVVIWLDQLEVIDYEKKTEIFYGMKGRSHFHYTIQKNPSFNKFDDMNKFYEIFRKIVVVLSPLHWKIDRLVLQFYEKKDLVGFCKTFFN